MPISETLAEQEARYEMEKERRQKIHKMTDELIDLGIDYSNSLSEGLLLKVYLRGGEQKHFYIETDDDGNQYQINGDMFLFDTPHGMLAIMKQSIIGFGIEDAD